jgi:restriction system protein
MSTTTMWMVRAGEGAWRIEEFERESLVSIGCMAMGDMGALRTREEFVQQVERSYPQAKKAWIPGAAGQAFRFVREMQVGDAVVTYNPAQRAYLVGTVTGPYEYLATLCAEQPNLRRVRWRGRVARDQLSVGTRNSLGAISTLFLIPREAAVEMDRLMAGPPEAAATAPSEAVAAEEVDDLYKDIQAKAFEFIKDKVSQLDWEDLQELVAGLLRAMGYKTRISPSGSDRGKDIVASPDGFGFEDPRIVVEVKHRTASMGAPELRSFLGGRHENDKGLYVSTGGFTKEARYEAERGRIPVTLLDLDDLVKALLEHYEGLDIQMQRLLPMRKLYWPV